MSTSLNMKITAAGSSALFNAQNTGTNLNLTHIQFGSGNRTPNGTETKLVTPAQVAPITNGSKISSNQIRMSAVFTGSTNYSVCEIGIWAGDPTKSGSVLFAYWSQPSGNIAVMSAGVDFVFSHDMTLDSSAGAAINVIVDSTGNVATALMNAHESAANPHPQYVSGDFDQTGKSAAWKQQVLTNIGGAAATAIPAASTTAPKVDGTAAVGTGTTWARADHVHPTDTSRAAVGSTLPLVDGTAAAGTATTAARSDHVHPTDTSRAAVGSTAPLMDGTAAAGTLATAARSDHVHPTDTTRQAALNRTVQTNLASATAITDTGGNITPGVTGVLPIANGGTGVTTGVPAASTTAPVMDGTAAVGTGTTWARADHVHPTDTTRAAVGTVVPLMDGTAAAGVAATAARSDHVHPTDTTRQAALNRTIQTNLASTAAATDTGGNITPGVTGTLPIANGGTGNTTGLAATATALATGRTIALSGGATGTATSFNGTANITIPVTSLDATKLSGAIPATVLDSSANRVKTIYVATNDGNDTNAGTTRATSVKTITQALKLVPNDCTLVLYIHANIAVEPAAWLSNTAYNIGDQVTYNGYTYKAVAASTGVTPSLTTGADTWQFVPLAATTGGVWSATTAYAVGNTVTWSNGNQTLSFVCLTANTGQSPASATTMYWALAGINNAIIPPITVQNYSGVQIYTQSTGYTNSQQKVVCTGGINLNNNPNVLVGTQFEAAGGLTLNYVGSLFFSAPVVANNVALSYSFGRFNGAVTLFSTFTATGSYIACGSNLTITTQSSSQAGLTCDANSRLLLFGLNTLTGYNNGSAANTSMGIVCKNGSLIQSYGNVTTSGFGTGIQCTCGGWYINGSANTTLDKDNNTTATPIAIQVDARSVFENLGGTTITRTNTADKIDPAGLFINTAGPAASTTTPVMNGTAAPGNENAWARGNHVHPTDTSRQAALNRTVQTNLAATTAATDTGGNITPGVTGILPIANGGTGVTTGVPAASTTTPVMNGAAAPGNENAWARGNHVHPTDTTRAAVGSTLPLVDGTASAGTAATAARSDHVHPRSPGKLVGVKVFNSSGTYTPAAGLSNIIVEAVGGGGGGGGAEATGANGYSLSGGGGGGSYAKIQISPAPTAAQTVTIGAGGAGGAASATASGISGGITSFGSYLSCPAGGGASPPNTFTSNTPISAGGVPGQGGGPCTISGTGVTTLVNSTGDVGGWGMLFPSQSFLGGEGGGSVFGPGSSRSASQTAEPGVSPGSGGSGAGNLPNATSGYTGGAGKAGIVIVYEYS